MSSIIDPLSGKKKAGRGSRPVIDARSRMLISTLRDFFAKERDTLAPAFPPEDTIGRTACALKLNIDTVKSVLNDKITGCETYNSDTDSDDEIKSETTIGFPDVDCFKMESIRQIIHSFLAKSEILTRFKLRKVLKKNNLLPRSRSLTCILSHLGFYSKSCLSSEVLLERPDYVSKRCKFLRSMVSINLKHIYWIGETCLYLACVNKVPYYAKRRGTMNKGGRIILLHVGSSDGWVPGVEQLIVSNKINDFHDDIGTKGFLRWFNNLLQMLPNNSTIALEDNFCHSEEVDKAPKEHNSREEIMEWLGRHNVWLEEEASAFSKAELLALVAETKPFYPTYLAEETASRYGHTLIRLPPEHSHFNPIERIFQQIQATVDKRADSMGGLSLTDLESQTHLAVSGVSQKNWSDAVTQVGHFLSKYWTQEKKLQEGVEILLQNIAQLKKNGQAFINKDGSIENYAISDTESESEYHSSKIKRIKITDPDPKIMKKILEREAKECAKECEIWAAKEKLKTTQVNTEKQSSPTDGLTIQMPSKRIYKLFKFKMKQKNNIKPARKQYRLLPKPITPNLVETNSGPSLLPYQIIDASRLLSIKSKTIVLDRIADKTNATKYYTAVESTKLNSEVNCTESTAYSPDQQSSENMGLFAIAMESEDSLSDVPDTETQFKTNN